MAPSDGAAETKVSIIFLLEEFPAASLWITVDPIRQTCRKTFLWIYDHNNVDDVDSAATPTMDKAEAQQTRFRKLFDKLDINKDGRIEASELATALRASSAAISEDDVKVFAKVRSQLACFRVVRLSHCATD